MFPSQTLFGHRLLVCGHSRIVTALQSWSAAPPSLWRTQTVLLEALPWCRSLSLESDTLSTEQPAFWSPS